MLSYRHSFHAGNFAICHPVVSHNNTERFCNQFKNSGIKNILRLELNLKEDSNEHGMTGTGMIIINPPWKLAQQMQQVLPWLVEKLKQDNYANYKLEQLTKERVKVLWGERKMSRKFANKGGKRCD